MAADQRVVTVSIPSFASKPFVDIAIERSSQMLKYSTAHDDMSGTNHLVNEAVYRLTHMGEAPTDDLARHAMVEAAALLVAAIEVIDRGGIVEPIA